MKGQMLSWNEPQESSGGAQRAQRARIIGSVQRTRAQCGDPNAAPSSGMRSAVEAMPGGVPSRAKNLDECRGV